MKFEEALAAMRKGKKIRHIYFQDDEYLMACYITINPLLCPDRVETVEKVKTRGMSITWMLGNSVHPKMRPKLSGKCTDINHNYPMLNLLLIMDNDWEIVND